LSSPAIIRPAMTISTQSCPRTSTLIVKQNTAYDVGLGIPAKPLFRSEPQLRDENAHNDKSVHGVLNPTYQAGLRRDAVQPDIEAERKKRDEIEAGKSYCSRRFGGATCDDKSAQIY